MVQEQPNQQFCGLHFERDESLWTADNRSCKENQDTIWGWLGLHTLLSVKYDNQKSKKSYWAFSKPVEGIMAQSQCWRSVGDKFWPGVVVENKESLNNRSSNPNKSGAVTWSEMF